MLAPPYPPSLGLSLRQSIMHVTPRLSSTAPETAALSFCGMKPKLGLTSASTTTKNDVGGGGVDSDAVVDTVRLSLEPFGVDIVEPVCLGW